MKTLVVLFAMLLGSFAQAQSTESGHIQVKVPNVLGNEGKIIFGLYSAETFMKSKPEFSAEAEIEDGEAVAEFKNVPEGTYAILILHDKNLNDKMDFGANGMPLENYATTGEIISYGPPLWEEAMFDYDGSEKNIEIRF